MNVLDLKEKLIEDVFTVKGFISLEVEASRGDVSEEQRTGTLCTELL